MQQDERRLVRHLAWMVAIKLIVLASLWWAFVRDQRTHPDAAAIAQHLAATAPQQGGSR